MGARSIFEMGSSMVRRRSSLYANTQTQPTLRAVVEVDREVLIISKPDGGNDRVQLPGALHSVCDAVQRRRFVGHLRISTSQNRVDLITPPEKGAIAPRVAALPSVPATATVIDVVSWEALRDWIETGGRFTGRTIAELALLARIASSQFAITLGELAAATAVQIACQRGSPMRRGVDVSWLLRPFEQAARSSARAADALVAAFAHIAMRSAV